MSHTIITGGSCGIGLEIALLIATKTNLTIISRNIDNLRSARKKILSVAPKCQLYLINCDVSNNKKLKDKIKNACIKQGAPSHLFCSAGVAESAPFIEMPNDNFEEMISINYLGVVHSIKAVIPLMDKSNKNFITLVASQASLIGIYGMSSYCASKFALLGLAESIRYELKQQNIVLSVALPPNTKTNQLTKINQQKNKATLLITSVLGTKSASAVAKRIVKSSQKSRYRITFSLQEFLFYYSVSFIKPVLNYCFDKLIYRTQKQ